MTLLHQYTQQIELMREGKILTPQGNFYTPGTIDNWEFFVSHILGFQEALEREILVQEIDFDLCNEFHLYLINEGLAKNSVTAYMSTFRAFIKRCYNKKMLAYSGTGLRLSTELTTAIYCTIDDIRALSAFDLSDTPGMERVRDFFVMQCFLGLRVSDMFTFVNEYQKILREIEGRHFFEIRTQKSNQPVVIPAATAVLEILERRKGQLGRMFSQQHYSKTMKLIIDRAGLDREILFSRTEGGVMQTRTVLYSELLGTHTARRTFATNAYLMGINPLDIMKITGHKSFASFMRYIRCENMAVALKIASHEFFNLSLKQP